MAGNLNSRLAKVERGLACIKEKYDQADCICNALVGLSRETLEQFRAEMNRPCPVHGFRELHIIYFFSVEPAHDLNSRAIVIEDPEVNAALEEYERRRAGSQTKRYEDEEPRFAL